MIQYSKLREQYLNQTIFLRRNFMKNKDFCDSPKKVAEPDPILSALDACIRGSEKILSDPKKREQVRKIYRGRCY